MKNADMPAMPTQTYDHGAAMQGLAVTVTEHAGLTKREMMAMHAPVMPDWFSREWSRKNEGNGQYFTEALSECDATCQTLFVEMTPAGRSAMYFAWRTHYSDAMLHELDRTSK